MSDYPEHERLQEIKDQSGAVGDFIEWIRNGTRFVICITPALSGRYFPYLESTEKLLSEYFDIDLEKISDEKDKMVEEMRLMNK